MEKIVKTLPELEVFEKEGFGGDVVFESDSKDIIQISKKYTYQLCLRKGNFVVYDSAQIHYVSGSAQIHRVSGSAQIHRVSGSAQIHYVSGSAQIHYVSDSAQIHYVYDSTQIHAVSGSAQIHYVYDSTQIHAVSGSAQIHRVSGSAQIHYVSGSAQIHYVYDSAIVHVISNDVKIKTVEDIATIIFTDCRTKLKKTKHVSIVKRSTKNIKPITTKKWAERNAAKIDKDSVTLYKKVSYDFKTQEGTENETLWLPGSTVTHLNWDPKGTECGKGKFHACACPKDCDLFRNRENDKYVVLKVALGDCYAWPKNSEYPMKIGFRSGEVLYECDVLGFKK